MDLKIQRPSPTCKTSGSEFKAGDLMFSMLVREEGRLVRCDWSHEAWSGALMKHSHGGEVLCLSKKMRSLSCPR